MYYIGIDLGGTNIAAGITDTEGNILYKGSDAPDFVKRNLRVAAEHAAERRDVVDDGVAPARCAGGQGARQEAQRTP